MLARSAFRLASRSAFRPAVSSVQISRGFTNSPKVNDPETVSEDQINVTHYNQGRRTEENLKVDHNAGPVSPPGQDIEAKAIPLKNSVLESLTPTLRRFTLPGKVAMVTG